MSAEEAVKNETMDTETDENATAQDDEDETLYLASRLTRKVLCKANGIKKCY